MYRPIRYGKPGPLFVPLVIRPIHLLPLKGWDDVKEFKGVPKGWIVAPTFAGLDRCHRWSKDHEYLVVSSENMIYIAMIQLMLRRLAINST